VSAINDTTIYSGPEGKPLRPRDESPEAQARRDAELAYWTTPQPARTVRVASNPDAVAERDAAVADARARLATAQEAHDPAAVEIARADLAAAKGKVARTANGVAPNIVVQT
jgi:hypothetical protein